MRFGHTAALRTYLIVAGWVLALSGIGQMALPRMIAEGSIWGLAPGWQREIAFFDISLAWIAFRAARADDSRFQRNVTAAFVLLTALIGTNHLFAVLSGGTTWVHLTFAAVNYLGVAFGCLVLLTKQDTQPIKSGNRRPD